MPSVCTIDEGGQGQGEDAYAGVGEYLDDISRKRLGPMLVRQARPDELEVYRKRKVYVKVQIEEFLRNTGKRPIGSR